MEKIRPLTWPFPRQNVLFLCPDSSICRPDFLLVMGYSLYMLSQLPWIPQAGSTAVVLKLSCICVKNINYRYYLLFFYCLLLKNILFSSGFKFISIDLSSSSLTLSSVISKVILSPFSTFLILNILESLFYCY